MESEIGNKNILVIGVGRSGIAAAFTLKKLGANITIQDSKKEEEFDASLISRFKSEGINLCLGEKPKNATSYDMIVLSPGVSPELEFVQEAATAGVEITGELEMAYRIGKGTYIAITGTNGKTTTTTLVGEIFKAAGKETFVGGNIGYAVISQAEEATEDSYLVTETSSFQLETTKYFKPHVSAILNLTPDHLNRHHTFEAYAEAKAKIFANQDENDYFIVNNEDDYCMKLSEKCKAKVVPFSSVHELDFGAFVMDGSLVIKNEKAEIIPICKISNMKIIGKHNVENALTAAAMAYFAGIDPAVISETIENFGGVAHRLEFCGEINGVKYYNDSKGTNTDATITALNAIQENIILIAGGDSKAQKFEPLIEHFPGKVKKMILLGRDAHFIQEAAVEAGFLDIINCRDMKDCVETAYEIAEAGDNVVLSPACASWDMYDNFEQRGDDFKNCVKGLEK